MVELNRLHTAYSWRVHEGSAAAKSYAVDDKVHCSSKREEINLHLDGHKKSNEKIDHIGKRLNGAVTGAVENK